MRLNDLAYAPEVAAAMLKIQQACFPPRLILILKYTPSFNLQARALVQARELIVEGAVRIAQVTFSKDDEVLSCSLSFRML
jgi:hypothetical protein